MAAVCRLAFCRSAAADHPHGRHAPVAASTGALAARPPVRYKPHPPRNRMDTTRIRWKKQYSEPCSGTRPFASNAIERACYDANDPYNLQRFVDAQEPVYEQVCAELRAGLQNQSLDMVHLPADCRTRLQPDGTALRDLRPRRRRSATCSIRCSVPGWQNVRAW